MKYIWYPFFCILSLLFTANLSAQNNHFKNYSLAEGLPQSDVVDVVQDPSGYLWFATQGGGIARFDGEHFKVYTQNEGLLSNFANSVLIRNDSLFIGTNNGLSILHKGRFINFKTPKINALLSKGQKLFLATNEGIYAFKKDYVIPLKLTLKIDLSRVENITYNNSFFWIKTTQELWKIDTLYQPKTIQIASKKKRGRWIPKKSIY